MLIMTILNRGYGQTDRPTLGRVFNMILLYCAIETSKSIQLDPQKFVDPNSTQTLQI